MPNMSQVRYRQLDEPLEIFGGWLFCADDCERNGTRRNLCYGLRSQGRDTRVATQSIPRWPLSYGFEYIEYQGPRGSIPMYPPQLRISSRFNEVEWLAARMAPFGSGVTAVVPRGYASYSRILHPAAGTNGEKLRWADVAAKSGCTMHRLVQFHAIHRPTASLFHIVAPEPGNLPSDLLKILCVTLSKHTSTPDSCCFCLWDGYGWLRQAGASIMTFGVRSGLASEPSILDNTVAPALSPTLSAAVLNRARVHLPNRNYLLFEGPLEAATELGWTMGGGTFVAQSPNLFWPRDHAWCIASEIDLFCTLVAGSNALAQDLNVHPDLEVWHVFANDPISANSDVENT